MSLALVALAGCSAVVGDARRVHADPPRPVEQVRVYSLLPLHTMGSEKLHHDLRGFEPQLTGALDAVGVRGTLADVEFLVRSQSLPLHFHVQEQADTSERRLVGLLPERSLLEADGSAAPPTAHRLVLFPASVSVHAVSGAVTGSVHWRLYDPAGTPIAIGVFRYSADARGFPGLAMAREIATQLQKLGLASRSASAAAQG